MLHKIFRSKTTNRIEYLKYFADAAYTEESIKKLLNEEIDTLLFYQKTGFKDTTRNFRKFYCNFGKLNKLDQSIIASQFDVDDNGKVKFFYDTFMLIINLIISISVIIFFYLLANYLPTIYSPIIHYFFIFIVPLVIFFLTTRKTILHYIFSCIRWKAIAKKINYSL